MATITGTMSKGATQNFGAFYEEYFDRVYNYARHRTGSATRADEIVSDTFTRVLDAWPRFDPEKGDRRSWLFSIAFRAVADHYRGEKRRGWFSLGLLSGRKEEHEKPASAPEGQENLTNALNALSEEHREIVSLKFFSGMSNRAIAKLMGLTEANVGIIIFRSVRRMRKSISSGGEAGHE